MFCNFASYLYSNTLKYSAYIYFILHVFYTPVYRFFQKHDMRHNLIFQTWKQKRKIKTLFGFTNFMKKTDVLFH